MKSISDLLKKSCIETDLCCPLVTAKINLLQVAITIVRSIGLTEDLSRHDLEDHIDDLVAEKGERLRLGEPEPEDLPAKIACLKSAIFILNEVEKL